MKAEAVRTSCCKTSAALELPLSAALGQAELAAPLEGAALAAQALSGLGKRESKTGRFLRGIHEVSNASRGIETGGYGKKLKKKARYALQNSE